MSCVLFFFINRQQQLGILKQNIDEEQQAVSAPGRLLCPHPRSLSLGVLTSPARGIGVLILCVLGCIVASGFALCAVLCGEGTGQHHSEAAH